MSARALVVRRDADRDAVWAGTVVVAAGSIVLAFRPFAMVFGGTRVMLLGASYLVIGVASIAVPIEADRHRMSPVATLAFGVAALVGTALIIGPSVPTPWGSATLPLSLLAAVAEEALFRRVAFARLERFGAVVAIVGSALLFGLIHVPTYGPAALPVDIGGGLLFGWQRWASGTWTVSAATHAFANALVALR